MTKFAPFKMDDLECLHVQPRHQDTLSSILELRNDVLEHYMVNIWATTVWTDADTALACYGILPGGAGWAFLDKDLRRFLVPITRHARFVLQRYTMEVGPTYIDVDPEFEEGTRWAKALGYTQTHYQNRWVQE